MVHGQRGNAIAIHYLGGCYYYLCKHNCGNCKDICDKLNVLHYVILAFVILFYCTGLVLHNGGLFALKRIIRFYIKLVHQIKRISIVETHSINRISKSSKASRALPSYSHVIKSFCLPSSSSNIKSGISHHSSSSHLPPLHLNCPRHNMYTSRALLRASRTVPQRLAAGPAAISTSQIRAYAAPAIDSKPPVALYGVDGTYASALVCFVTAFPSLECVVGRQLSRGRS
jgi:hypothetical protein